MRILDHIQSIYNLFLRDLVSRLQTTVLKYCGEAIILIVIFNENLVNIMLSNFHQCLNNNFTIKNKKLIISRSRSP